MNARDRRSSASKTRVQSQAAPPPGKPDKQARPAENPAGLPDLARWIQKVRQLPAVREDLVQRIKAEIAAGKYETPEKLDVAAKRLLKDVSEG